MPPVTSLFRSTSYLFESHQPLWPAPEESVGSKCQYVGSLVAWEAVGPALEVMEKLAVEIGALLEKHKDSLEHSEDKPRTISYNMWMVGSRPTCAEPTLVFSSKSSRKRRYAKALLLDSKLLDAYPGVKVKTLEKMPAVYNAAVHNAGELPGTVSENDVYLVKSPGGACGSLIALGACKLATMGVVIEINGAYYGTTAQHSRFDYFVEPESPAAEGQVCNFDEDSDYGEDELIEITSQGSISPRFGLETDIGSIFPRSGSETDTGTSTISDSQSIGDSTPSPVTVSHPPPSFTEETEPNSRYENRILGPMISTLAPDCVANDLDYELFPLNDPKYHVSNSIQLPATKGSHLREIVPRGIARAAAETTVWAATGTTGCVKGTLMENPYFIKMTGSNSYQEMWPVKLERGTIPGDGACVVDEIGNLYGHIVAGDPVSGLAYIIPAYKIFDDIEQRRGARPKLATTAGAEKKAADEAGGNTVAAPPPPKEIKDRVPRNMLPYEDGEDEEDDIAENTYLHQIHGDSFDQHSFEPSTSSLNILDANINAYTPSTFALSAPARQSLCESLHLGCRQHTVVANDPNWLASSENIIFNNSSNAVPADFDDVFDMSPFLGDSQYYDGYDFAPFAEAGVEVNLMKRPSSTEPNELTMPSRATYIKSADEWSVNVAPIPKTPDARPTRGKVESTQCTDHPKDFRGEHELRRRVKHPHNTRKTFWVCVDISPDKKFLSQCRACRSKKKYYSYYNAAAHLRRAHFNPGAKGKGNDKGGGDTPSMETLKMWMTEDEKSTLPTLPSDDETNDDLLSVATLPLALEYQTVPDTQEIPMGGLLHVHGPSSMLPAPDIFAVPHFHEVQSHGKPVPTPSHT